MEEITLIDIFSIKDIKLEDYFKIIKNEMINLDDISKKIIELPDFKNLITFYFNMNLDIFEFVSNFYTVYSKCPNNKYGDFEIKLFPIDPDTGKPIPYENIKVENGMCYFTDQINSIYPEYKISDEKILELKIFLDKINNLENSESYIYNFLSKILPPKRSIYAFILGTILFSEGYKIFNNPSSGINNGLVNQATYNSTFQPQNFNIPQATYNNTVQPQNFNIPQATHNNTGCVTDQLNSNLIDTYVTEYYNKEYKNIFTNKNNTINYIKITDNITKMIIKKGNVKLKEVIIKSNNLQKFYTELDNLKKLQKFNFFPKLYSSFYSENTGYIIMENFENFLPLSKDTISEDIFYKTFSSLFNTINILHNFNMTHGNLTEEHILVNKLTGEIKLIAVKNLYPGTMSDTKYMNKAILESNLPLIEKYIKLDYYQIGMVIYKLFTGDEIPLYQEGLIFVQNNLDSIAKNNGREKGINIINLLFQDPNERFNILGIM